MNITNYKKNRTFVLLLKFSGTTLDMNTFVTLFNHLLKKMQQQESRHRSIISILNKIFGKHFTVFNNFADIEANFIKIFLLPCIRAIHIHLFLLYSLFLSYDFALLFIFSWFVSFLCVVIVLLLLLCHLSLSLCICSYLCSDRLAFCTIFLL